jgi:hypothetical protein
MKRNVWVGLLGLALSLILAACGSQGTGPGRGGLGAMASGPLVDPIPYIPWQPGNAQTECTQLGIPFDGAFKVDPPSRGRTP